MTMSRNSLARNDVPDANASSGVDKMIDRTDPNRISIHVHRDPSLSWHISLSVNANPANNTPDGAYKPGSTGMVHGPNPLHVPMFWIAQFAAAIVPT